MSEKRKKTWWNREGYTFDDIVGMNSAQREHYRLKIMQRAMLRLCLAAFCTIMFLTWLMYITSTTP